MTDTRLDDGPITPGKAGDALTKPFAKLFDTPHGQLLAFREYDTESDSDQVVLMGAAVNGVCPTVRNDYDSEEAADRQFETIDQAKAERTAASMNAMVRGLLERGGSNEE